MFYRFNVIRDVPSTQDLVNTTTDLTNQASTIISNGVDRASTRGQSHLISEL